jgi:hypothetical protein
MCPGRDRSSGAVLGSTIARIVVARSAAEIPVLTPRRASTDTVNAVCRWSVLSATINGISSASSRSPTTGMQITPLECRTMNAIASGVTFSAAMIRSPSFSRSASSTTITTRPARMSSTASGIVANGDPIMPTCSCSVIVLPPFRRPLATRRP